MNPEDAQQDRKAQKIFGRAVEMTTAEARRAYLEGGCDGDERLRARVEALLAHHVEDDFLQYSAAALGPGATAGMAVVTEKAGDRIGRYKLLQQIGEGGCGIVYVAEQEVPVRRRVALKVIKLGMDTRSVIARFEAERQALALMDHPNIAKVLDAGATETGRPYFVMELVRGIKLTDYCDQHKLPTRERLNLFIGVCHAIQHAHQKGIIHRDIKPSNILVTLHDGVPVPKVIDFGIAKATSQQRLTDRTVYTAFEQFIGTPAYMSPEQAEMSGLDIDTRSDVYALGVLLYELLTGRTPFDAKTLLASGLNEMRRIICEQEPVPPSTRLHSLTAEELTTTAQHRHAEPPKLIGLLRGDLDWIVMKCLEKDRTRRYETANGLAGDLKRHLNLELVTARPPSTPYRVQKFVRRNKLVVAAGTAVAATLVMGVIGSAWFALQENEQRKHAQESAVRERAQRERAEASEEAARQALVSEANQRRAAEEARRKARLHAYASDIQLAQSTLERGDFGRAKELLDRHIPEAGQQDQRGWEWRYLRGQLLPDNIRTIGRHQSPLTALAFLGSRRLLLGSAQDQTIGLWDFESGQLLDAIQGNGDPSDLAVHPDGHGFAVCVGGTNVFLYANDPLRLQATLPTDFNTFRVTFSRNGKHLAASGNHERGETQVLIWDLAQTNYPAGPKWSINSVDQCIAFSPIDDQLAFMTEDSTISLYALRQGGVTGVYSWLADGADVPRHLNYISFSPDGSLMAAGDSEGQLTMIDLTRRSAELLARYAQALECGAFSPDGTCLATAGRDGSVHLWSITEHKEHLSLVGHGERVSSLAFTPDGRFLVTVGTDKTCRVWDIRRTARREALVKEIPIPFGMTSPDGRFLLGLDDWVFRDGMDFSLFKEGVLWDLRLFKRGGTLRVPEEGVGKAIHKHGTSSLPAVAPDGTKAVFGVKNQTLVEWDLQANRFEVFASTGTNIVESLVFSSNGRLLAAAGENGAITIYDFQRRKATLNLPPQTVTVPFFAHQMTFCNDGNRLIVVHRGTLTAFDVQSGQLTERVEASSIPGTEPKSQSVFLSPDGMTLATLQTLGNGGRLILSNAQTLQSLHEFSCDAGFNQGAAFSGDDDRVFYYEQGRISVRNVANGRHLLTLDPGFRSGMCLECDPQSGNLVVLDARSGPRVGRMWRVPSFADIEAAEDVTAEAAGTVASE